MDKMLKKLIILVIITAVIGLISYASVFDRMTKAALVSSTATKLENIKTLQDIQGLKMQVGILNEQLKAQVNNEGFKDIASYVSVNIDKLQLSNDLKDIDTTCSKNVKLSFTQYVASNTGTRKFVPSTSTIDYMPSRCFGSKLFMSCNVPKEYPATGYFWTFPTWCPDNLECREVKLPFVVYQRTVFPKIVEGETTIDTQILEEEGGYIVSSDSTEHIYLTFCGQNPVLNDRVVII
jgi:hypothetical protein